MAWCLVPVKMAIIKIDKIVGNSRDSESKSKQWPQYLAVLTGKALLIIL